MATPFGFAAHTPPEFEVTDLRACIAADFTLRAESAAHGLVVDETGRPLSGILVEAVAAELAGYQPDTIFEAAKPTTAAGLPSTTCPRAYVFGVNLTKGRYKPPSGPARFLPGAVTAKGATVFELKAGDRTDLRVLRLTSR